MTGGTGFIGQALVPSLLSAGHELTVLTRQAKPDTPGLRYIQSLEALPEHPCDAVINLAGASMAGKRWSDAYKTELLASRIDTTRALITALTKLPSPPQTLLSGSAVGFYGPHSDQLLAEDSHSTPAFSSQLCQHWEREAQAAEALGIRTVLLRLGVVLDAPGGALDDMARPFRFGLANWMGRGEQWLSWVHRADVVSAVQFLLDSDCLSGPFNLTAPTPVTSREFCKAMRGQFKTLPPVGIPGPVLSLALGEMAQELLLSGQRVVPAALQAAGFEFQFKQLDGALTEIFQRPASAQPGPKA